MAGPDDDPTRRLGDPEVLVIGAGPVGLVLACELRQQGVDVRLVDRRHDQLDRSRGQSRAILVWPRILEQLRRIEVSDRMVAAGHVLRDVGYYSEGILRGTVRMDVLTDSPYPLILTLSQNETERILLERLTELGGHVDVGRTLVGIDHSAGQPNVTLVSPQGDREMVRPDWLVAADGASSTARDLLGIDFAALPIDISYGIGDFEIDGDVPQTVQYRYSSQGIVVVVPLRDRLFRIAANIDHRNPGDGPPSAALFQQLMTRRGRLDVTLSEPRWTSSFRPRCGVATSYRKGRCFLAGDAAHVVSPAGGQGMNLGLQDAVNLGWKLGAVVTGRMSESTLADYEPERSGAASTVGRTSAVQVRLGTTQGTAKRALRDHLFSLSARLGILQRNLGPLLSQNGFSYGDVRRFDRVRLRDRSAITVGERVPLFAGPPVSPGLPILARDGFTVLLSSGRRADSGARALLDSARRQLETLAEVRDVTGAISRRDPVLAPAFGPDPVAAVVRPDGHLAHRCPLGHADEAAQYLRAAGVPERRSTTLDPSNRGDSAMSTADETDNATRATLAEFFGHFGDGDAEALLRMFAPGCDLEVAGSATVPWTGRRSSEPEIKEFVRAVLEDVHTERFDVSETIVSGGDVTVLGRFAHRVVATDKVFTGPFALHLQVVDGLIVTYRMYEDSLAAHEAFSR